MKQDAIPYNSANKMGARTMCGECYHTVDRPIEEMDSILGDAQICDT